MVCPRRLAENWDGRTQARRRRRARVIATSLLALAFYLACESRAWSTDSLYLKTGLLVKGKILRETARDITIQAQDGVLTFPRANIQEIRRDSEVVYTDEGGDRRIEPADKDGQDGEGAKEPSPGPGVNATPPAVKTRVQEILGELARVRLEPWTTEPPHRVDSEERAAAFKVQTLKGTTSYAQRQPLSSEGVGKIWMRRACPRGESVGREDTAERFEWVRLYWHGQRNRWSELEPAQAAFQDDDSRVRGLVTLVSRPYPELQRRVEALSAELREAKGPESEVARRVSELRELCGQVGYFWGGGDALLEVHLLTLEIERSLSIADKVALARKRRDAARRLGQAFVENS
jgi:hypothetical protein